MHAYNDLQLYAVKKFIRFVVNRIAHMGERLCFSHCDICSFSEVPHSCTCHAYHATVCAKKCVIVNAHITVRAPE